MRKFPYDNEEVDNFFDNNGDDDDEDFDEDENFDDFDEMISIDLTNININQKIMETAISIAEKTWFWNFRSLNKRLEILEKIYQRLRNMFLDADPK